MLTRHLRDPTVGHDGHWAGIGDGDEGRGQNATASGGASSENVVGLARCSQTSRRRHAHRNRGEPFPPFPIPLTPSPNRLTRWNGVDNFPRLDLVKVFTKLGDTCYTRTSRSCFCSA